MKAVILFLLVCILCHYIGVQWLYTGANVAAHVVNFIIRCVANVSH